MRFRTTQTSLTEAFDHVIPVVPVRSTLPILSNVLLTLEGNRLRLVSTDLEITVVTEVEVNGEEDGAISVTAKKIGEIFKELVDFEVECWTDENNHLQLKAGEGEYMVPGISSNEFPALPKFESSAQIDFKSDKLDSIIQRTTFAVSTDELRPALTGVFFQFRPTEMRAIATDGHRLVRIVDQDFEFNGEPLELIIPVKALNAIKRNLSNEKDVQLVIGREQVMIKLDDSTVYSRLIEGKYPHYESVIPENNENRLVVAVDELIRTIKRVQIFSNPINRQVVFTMTPEQLEVVSEDIELGARGRDVIKANYKGDLDKIGYNSGYVLEMLKMIETDEVRFDLGGGTQAGIIRPINQKEKEDFLMIIMPVRLD